MTTPLPRTSLGITRRSRRSNAGASARSTMPLANRRGLTVPSEWCTCAKGVRVPAATRNKRLRANFSCVPFAAAERRDRFSDRRRTPRHDRSKVGHEILLKTNFAARHLDLGGHPLGARKASDHGGIEVAADFCLVASGAPRGRRRPVGSVGSSQSRQPAAVAARSGVS